MKAAEAAQAAERKRPRLKPKAGAAASKASIHVNLPAVSELLVAYSGGKDALTVVDLCIRAGKKVECMFWQFLPGLDYTEFWCNYVERRWKVKVHRYQHFFQADLLRAGVCRVDPDLTVPALKLSDLEFAARQDSGFDWIGYGYKSLDSMERRAMMAHWEGGMDPKTRRFAPIKDWSEKDVWAYLMKARIETPDSFGKKRSTEISLKPESMAYMREFWPEDYRRIISVFPGAAGQADRAILLREMARKQRAEKQLLRLAQKGVQALHSTDGRVS